MSTHDMPAMFALLALVRVGKVRIGTQREQCGTRRYKDTMIRHKREPSSFFIHNSQSWLGSTHSPFLNDNKQNAQNPHSL
jgi:hypothetical protein